MKKVLLNGILLLSALLLFSCIGGDGEGIDDDGNPLGATSPVGCVDGEFYQFPENDESAVTLYNEVATIFESKCFPCHIGSSPQKGLSWEKSKICQQIGKPTTHEGETYIIPGNPDSSFVIKKLTGSQESDEGNQMPPGNPLSNDQIETVRQFIEALPQQ